MQKHCIGAMESPREGGLAVSPSALQLLQTRAKMEKAGLFRVDHWNYVILAAGLVVAFTAVLMCVAARWVVPGGLLMALFWQQVCNIGLHFNGLDLRSHVTMHSAKLSRSNSL